MSEPTKLASRTLLTSLDLLKKQRRTLWAERKDGALEERTVMGERPLHLLRLELRSLLFHKPRKPPNFKRDLGEHQVKILVCISLRASPPHSA
jgi:hypothetical protein